MLDAPQILGRKVIAFLSDDRTDPDVAVEVFLLAPMTPVRTSDGRARGVAKTWREAIAGAEVGPVDRGARASGS